MTTLDDLDRALIAQLSADGRASVSALATTLHVARGTVQSRLARLVDTGVIRRFTIELDPGIEVHTIRAMTNIQLTGVMSRTVARGLAELPAVRALHTTNGTWDLVAELQTGSLLELDAALGAIRSIRGVSNTETSILLSTL